MTEPRYWEQLGRGLYESVITLLRKYRLKADDARGHAHEACVRYASYCGGIRHQARLTPCVKKGC